MSDSELFARYGSDLTVPSLTTYRFIYTNETEKKKLLTFITKHHTSFRQDWPVEVTQTEDTVTVWIAGKLAFNYEGIPVSCWAYYDNCKREGDYAIIKKGLKNYHPWSSLWFRLPLRRLPIAKVLLSYRPENYLPWKSYSIDNEYLGKRIDRLISTPSGLQILHSEADYADFHSCPLIRKKLSTSLLFCEPAVLNIPNQNAEPDPNQNPDPNANPGPNQEIVVMNQEQLLAELQRLRDGYAALDRGTLNLVVAFMNTHRRLAHKDFIHEWSLQVFLRGLRDPLRRYLKARNPLTLAEALNLMTNEFQFENLDNYKDGNSSGSSQKKPNQNFQNKSGNKNNQFQNYAQQNKGYGNQGQNKPNFQNQNKPNYSNQNKPNFQNKSNFNQNRGSNQKFN
ncbi:unnamed protein product [Bemisia tabaci]|uniref:Uncharacterized protein n=1 Tax=Bemisia tabaci TaxID=7038 RepID=A0A9P0A7A4_BEMTA|nr:unnamed protein product [Bemisia tabaci]